MLILSVVAVQMRAADSDDDVCGVLESINQCPALMAPFFMYSPEPVTKGTG